MRIVSLVPSLTCLVHQMGQGEKLVGCTNFCIEPPHIHRQCQLIGGTKNPDLQAISALGPTHILTNDEENQSEHLNQLSKNFEIFRCLPRTIKDVVRLCYDLGVYLNNQTAFQQRAAQIEEILTQVPYINGPKRRFAYLIWRDPYMGVSQDTYISHLLEDLGFENVLLSPPESRYPVVTIESLKERSIDLLFLSTEPYPFRKRDAIRLKKEWPEAPPMYRIDGRMMSWFGSHTLEALLRVKAFADGNEQKSIHQFDLI